MDEEDRQSRQALREMLRCPLSGERLRPASAQQCSRAREVAGGDASWDAGLVDAAGTHFYPVEEGIPVVVAERAIALQ